MVASALLQLSGSENESDGEEKKNPTQASSNNADKKVKLKSILKKSNQIWSFPEVSTGVIYSLSIKEREYKTLLLGSIKKSDRGCLNNNWS